MMPCRVLTQYNMRSACHTFEFENYFFYRLANNCNACYYPENCRNCDEFSYWYNFDKTTPLETNVNNWNDIDLNNFYDPTNGECKNFKCSCVNGIPLQNMCTKESQQKCETCNNGFYLTKSSECLKQRCFCENGSVDDHCQSTTPKQKCKSCHYGYHLTHSGVCQLNDCFCDYGATSSICPMNGISNCGFCHSTFMLLHAQCICPSAMTIKSRKCEPTGDIQINLKLIKPTGGFTTPWQEYLVDSAGKVLDDNEQLELYFKLSFGEFVRNTKVIKTNSQTDVLNFGYSVSSTKFYENLDVGGSYFAIELFEEDFFSSNEMAFKFQYGSVVFMEQFKRTGLVGFKDDVGKDGAVKFEFEILVHK